MLNELTLTGIIITTLAYGNRVVSLVVGIVLIVLGLLKITL